MAPTKFGLFKSRSRDHQEQPSTENLLKNNSSNDLMASPSSPVPSTSKTPEDLAASDMCILTIDSDDDDLSEHKTPIRRVSDSEKLRLGDSQVNYQELQSNTSLAATSTSTLHDDYDDIHHYEADDDHTSFDNDDASTTFDVNSIQLDAESNSDDLSVYCSALMKSKKSRSKEEEEIRDMNMWRASDFQVLQSLLSRSGTLDDQIKWEAIATARGLCTLTDSCNCGDCSSAKYMASISDGDGGLGTAPLINAVNLGCTLQ